MRITVKIGVVQALPALRIELFETPVYPRAAQRQVGRFFGRQGLHLFLVKRTQPGMIANMVERKMPCNGEHPAARRPTLRIETGSTGPDSHKGVVHNVLGQGPVANYAQSNRQQASALMFIQTMQGFAVAAGTPLQGNFMIEWIFRQRQERPPWQVEEEGSLSSVDQTRGFAAPRAESALFLRDRFYLADQKI